MAAKCLLVVQSNQNQNWPGRTIELVVHHGRILAYGPVIMSQNSHPCNKKSGPSFLLVRTISTAYLGLLSTFVELSTV